MEADWAHYYPAVAGGDFRRALFGPDPIGGRRLRALIDGLPPDAMLWRRVPGWGSTEELLALNAEVTHAVVRVLIAAFSKKGASVPKPLRVPRPEREPAPAAEARPLRPTDLTGFGIAVGSRGDR